MADPISIKDSDSSLKWNNQMTLNYISLIRETSWKFAVNMADSISLMVRAYTLKATDSSLWY